MVQQRRSARSVEAVDSFTEMAKALDRLARLEEGQSAKVAEERPDPPKPGATPELEPGAVEGAPGETVAPTRPRKSWTRRNVIDAIKPNVTRKASRIVKRSAKERDAEQSKLAELAAWTGLQRSVKKPTRKGGRPQQGPAPMTPAERVKAYRERKKAEAAAKGTGGKRGRRGSKDR